MRDPDRLDAFYDELKKIHKEYYPDWRFGQFMVNIIKILGDPFYWEEDTFLENLWMMISYCET